MGYSGLEFMAGIPATVGGAVASNAGNFRQSIGERIKQIKILLEDKIFWIDWTKEMYDYRQINLFAGAIILGAELRLKVSSIKNIRAFIKRYYKEKLTKQPLFSPSAGCVFKNPAHITAGQLVEKLGLKREKIGGAKVSEKHANFIINIDKAKAIHVLSLIEFIQEQVDKHTGIKLEPEIKLVQ
jgi:UDP-N-acetylmuramate dehydrogenase